MEQLEKDGGRSMLTRRGGGGWGKRVATYGSQAWRARQESLREEGSPSFPRITDDSQKVFGKVDDGGLLYFM